ncbi:hypothetical protein QOT17_024905 [Balamuthia mandrillaris]
MNATRVLSFSSAAGKTGVVPKGGHFARRPVYYSCSLSSWFRLPEQGMSTHEVLSRASCFRTPWRKRMPRPSSSSSSSSSLLPKHHIIGSAHVTHPFLWPKYYPQEWLRFVQEEHTLYKLEFRELETGRVLLECPLKRKAYRHPTADLVVLHLEDEAATERDLHRVGIDFVSVPLNLSDLEKDQQLSFDGHWVNYNLIETSAPTLEQQQQEQQVPHIAFGHHRFHMGEKGFARTEREALPMGMCGGPVLNSRLECVGVVEGVVNPPPPLARATTRAGLFLGEEGGSSEEKEELWRMLNDIQGNAVYLTSSLVAEFLERVEEEYLATMTSNKQAEEVTTEEKERKAKERAAAAWKDLIL